MKPLLGGKGANLAEMTRIGLPVPPGFTITTEVCTYFYAAQAHLSARDAGPGRKRRREHGENHGHEVRRHEDDAAAGRGPLRRARFDAGHDGHDSEPRPQRRDRARAGRRRPRTSVSRGIAIAASSRCMATSSWACRSAKAKITSRSKPSSTNYKHENYRPARHRRHEADASTISRNWSRASRSW